MARFRNSAALLLVGLASAGCVGDYTGGNPALVSNRSMYSENQIVVQRTDYVFDIATNGNGVSASELGRLADWFTALQLQYGDRISIDDPLGSGDARDDVTRLLADYGMFVSEGAPVTAGTVQPGTARVIVSRAFASVPTCPNWRQARLPGAPISTAANFGCGINGNLAAMIANPNDLVLGQTGTVSGDAETAAKAVKQYRDTAPTGAKGLEATSTTGGN